MGEDPAALAVGDDGRRLKEIGEHGVATDAEINLDYMLVRRDGYCGTRGAMLSSAVSGAEHCAALAQGAGYSVFSLGTTFARGRCYAEDLSVTQDFRFLKEESQEPTVPGWRVATQSTIRFLRARAGHGGLNERACRR